MYNSSLRIVGIPEEAEDIMQESFLAAFRKLKYYSGEVSFGAWLKKIVINRSLDELRKRDLRHIWGRLSMLRKYYFSSKKFKTSSPIHLTLDAFNSVNMPFNSPVTPW